MTENLKVALLGANNSDVIGYFAAEESGQGVSLGASTQVRVKLAVTIDGTNFTLTTDRDIPFELFQHLKNGKNTATTKLLPFETTKKIPEPSRKRKAVEDQSWEPKRKSAFNTNLGTSGKKKFFKDGNIEISWVDIVELGNTYCGPNSKLQTLYDWAAENIYTFIDGQKCSISKMKNWEASIRQNRRRANATEPLVEFVEEPVQQQPASPPPPVQQQPVPPPPVPVKAENQFDSNQLNAEIDILPNSVFGGAEPTLAYVNMVDGLVDDLMNCVETFEKTKIPMTNSYYQVAADEPMVEFESTVRHPGYTTQIHFA